MNTQQMQNIDPRLLIKFQQSPSWAATQSQGTIDTAQYRVQSRKWTPDMRVVYETVQSGYQDMTTPPVTADMTSKQWEKALSSLVKVGALQVTVKE